MLTQRILTLSKIFSFSTLFVFICATQSFAAFSLTADPFEGGYDVRFGRINVHEAKKTKEVIIRVASDIGKQYRVFQRVERPLATADGAEIGKNQFKMYTLINSNAQGALERIDEQPIMLGDTVLYTSNPAGTSDTFRVVYTLEPTTSQTLGSYYGRIQYLLVPISSTQDQVLKEIQMYADLSNEGAVEVLTSTGTNTIKISSGDLDKPNVQAPSVSIKVKGNMGTRYRIYQQFEGAYLKSEKGEQFDLTKLMYKVKDMQSGAITQEAGVDTLKVKTLAYASDTSGTGDEILVSYLPTKELAQHKAGNFSGRINYTIEFDRTAGSIEPGIIGAVDFQVQVDPVFRLITTSLTADNKVQTAEGAAALQFGEVSPKTGAKKSKVKIVVESNTSKAYVVSQKFAGPMQNEKGYKLPKELFTYSVKKIDTSKGKPAVDVDTVVESEKDLPLFISDSKGNSDEFEVTYKLGVTADTQGGNYNTGISYSLSEL